MNLNRRLFLRGLGGAAVAAPFLNSVTQRAARAQGVPSPAAPKRLIVMFTHYGCLTDRWFPLKSHGVLSAADYQGTSLEVLAPHADKLLLPRGIRAMNEWTPTLSLGQGNDPSTQVVGSYFTCVPVTPNTDDPFSFDTATKLNAMPIAPSLDHVCAKQVSPGSAPLFLRVSGRSENTQSAISYSAAEQPFAGIGSARVALNQLTGFYQGAAGMLQDEYKVARGKSILDVVKDDLETLERYDMSLSDKERLAAWKELLHDTGKVVYSGQCSEDVAFALGLTEANLQEVDSSASGDISTKITDTLDSADLFSNLATLTALCDANRVIFLKYPGNYVFKGLGIDFENHGLNNRVGSAAMGGPCVSGVNDMLTTLDKYYAEKFAHLVTQLDAFSEGEGTLLDNCAAVWFQENSDGAAFNLNNMPIIQAGGCGGHFKTGHAVNVDDGTSDLHRGNSVAPCEVAGRVDGNKETGTPVEFGNAPINKYYCNLMNAIGVKADASGFPSEGGSQEVTHYGMYDETTDFIGGGTNPPKINDPGEFSSLRANS